MMFFSKNRGSIAIYVLFIVVGLLLASSFFMVYSRINLESTYMLFYNLQAEKASEYGIQKYLEALKEEYINGTPLPKFGQMGQTSKYEVEWKTEESLSEKIIGGGNITKQNIYESYPFVKDAWEYVSQLSLIGTKYSLSGDYNPKLSSDDFLISYINSGKNAINTHSIYFHDTSPSVQYSVEEQDYTFMDSYYYWDSVLNTMGVYYCLLYKDTVNNTTVVDIYNGFPENGEALSKISSFELQGDTENFELTGVYSQVLNSNFLYLISKQQGENIVVKKFITASKQLEDIDTIDETAIRSLSASCVWNPIINMEELYIGMVGVDNSFTGYLFYDGKKEELPAPNSVEVVDATKNVNINAVFSSNIGKSVVYMLMQNTEDGNYQTYRYINDTSTIWEELGEFNFGGSIKPEICGVYSPSFRYLVLSANGEGSIHRVTGICTSIGEVYKKNTGQRPLLARVRIKFKVELDYEKDPDTGQAKLLRVNVSEISKE